MAYFDRGLLRVEHFEHVNILAAEAEVGELVGIGLNQIFGNRIKLCHVRCLGLMNDESVPLVGKLRNVSI